MPNTAHILRIFSASKQDFVPEISKSPGEWFGLILNETCFYGESGGQEGDHGCLVLEEESVKQKSDNSPQQFQVMDCQVFGAYTLHIGQIIGDAAG